MRLMPITNSQQNQNTSPQSFKANLSDVRKVIISESKTPEESLLKAVAGEIFCTIERLRMNYHLNQAIEIPLDSTQVMLPDTAPEAAHKIERYLTSTVDDSSSVANMLKETQETVSLKTPGLVLKQLLHKNDIPRPEVLELNYFG